MAATPMSSSLMATTSALMLPTSTMVSVSRALRHIRPPILLELALGLLELPASFLLFLWSICFTQSGAVVVDLGQILAKLLAMRAVAASLLAVFMITASAMSSTTPAVMSTAFVLISMLGLED